MKKHFIKIIFSILIAQLLVFYLLAYYSGFKPKLTDNGDDTLHRHRQLLHNSSLHQLSKPLVMQASDQRVRFLRKYCKKHKKELTGTFPYYADGSWMSLLTRWIWMASPHHRLFYCATPKCGSTTWKSYLMEDLKINWTGIDTHE